MKVILTTRETRPWDSSSRRKLVCLLDETNSWRCLITGWAGSMSEVVVVCRELWSLLVDWLVSELVGGLVCSHIQTGLSTALGFTIVFVMSLEGILFAILLSLEWSQLYKFTSEKSFDLSFHYSHFLKRKANRKRFDPTTVQSWGSENWGYTKKCQQGNLTDKTRFQ